MVATIKGITGLIRKMRAAYSYCESATGKISNIHNISYTVTLLQDDGTEIKFNRVNPDEIKMEG